MQGLDTLLISILFTILASLMFGLATPMFKKATDNVGEIHPRKFKENLKINVKKLVLNKYMALAIIIHILGWLIFLMAISRYEVSVVTPVLSLTYVFTAIYSNRILHETLTIKEILGILIIIIGVVILTFPFNFI